ncbi:MAG: GAF domain-containing protein, partial [Halobacteria archaeon]|nr:GAF domain-containing protein [Halobacteria archaeon]
MSDSHPVVEKGGTSPLSETYCRKTVNADEMLGIYNAPEQGWRDDPAYRKYGLKCYLGAKILVDNELYGTVCFCDTGSRDDDFDHTEKIFVHLIARWISHELERRKHDEEI